VSSPSLRMNEMGMETELRGFPDGVPMERSLDSIAALVVVEGVTRRKDVKTGEGRDLVSILIGHTDIVQVTVSTPFTLYLSRTDESDPFGSLTLLYSSFEISRLQLLVSQ